MNMDSFQKHYYLQLSPKLFHPPKYVDEFLFTLDVRSTYYL